MFSMTAQPAELISAIKGIATLFRKVHTECGYDDTPEIAELREVIDSALRIATCRDTALDHLNVQVTGAKHIR